MTNCDHLQGSNVVDALTGFPDWVTWSYNKNHLPAEFHCTDGRYELAKALKNVDKSLPEYGHLEYLALAVGLALRDLVTLMNSEDPTEFPAWMQDSSSGRRFTEYLLKDCTKIYAADLDESPDK